MVPDDFFDDEVQKLFSEFRIQVSVAAELVQAPDLRLLALRVARGQLVGGFEPTNLLGALEPLGQQVHQRGVNIVNTGTDGQ